MFLSFRHGRKLGLAIGAIFLTLALQVFAQRSLSYQITESAINCGGDPQNGAVLSSPSFRITLDAIGDTVAGGPLASTSFSTDVGLPPSVRPPGEVLDVKFSNPTTLTWQPEPSVGTYRLYRGLLSDLPTSYGICLTPGGLAGEQATDGDTPSPGQCFIYLVTARNMINEEGTLGDNSAGVPHTNSAPCP